MKRFKKRTLALVLASVVTVVGTFAANNYKNSLMGLSFERTANNNINLVVQTKAPYEGNINLMRKDAGTYVLILPEVNSEAQTPDLQDVSANISSVSIGTMPYSNSAKGYTRITVKTNTPTTTLSATNQVYISTSENKGTYIPQRADNYIPPMSQKASSTTKKVAEQRVRTKVKPKQEPEDTEEKNTSPRIQEKVQEQVPVQKPNISESVPINTQNSNNTVYFLWAILIILACVLFYVKAKNKMQELSGEEINIDVSENSPKDTKFKQLKKIKSTINKLDSAYSTTTIPENIEYTVSNQPVEVVQSSEDLNIVDLDELFQEHKTKSDEKEDEENKALEDFLSGFSFDDEYSNQNNTESDELFDEETYERIINNQNAIFTKDDIDRIKKLLGIEIDDETKKNIEKYAISNPVENKPSKQKILENLVTDYAISQKIIFTKEDMNTLNQLITVELDNDFIADLRTNPQRTIEMEKEILESGEKSKKPSEIITLSVKNALPDLAEELRKQGGKKIESNHRAETIYFSEGYDVATLTLNSALPDLSTEINKKGAFDSKPSEKINYVDNNYTVGAGELKISSELPDLQDILAHPEKYNEPEEEEVVVDEEALLKNISNVQFKPFYDGTNEFEVLNDLNEVPSVDEIKEEFKQFKNFEISEEEPVNQVSDNNRKFQEINNNQSVNFDKTDSAQAQQEENITNAEEVPQNDISQTAKPEQNKFRFLKQTNVSTEELIRQIESARAQREVRKVRAPQQHQTKMPNTGSNIPVQQKEEVIRCILNGEVYSVVSSTVLEENKGCYLAKNDSGYAILGYVGDNLVKIKQYDNLKSEKIHARLSEKLNDGTLRFIVRIGVTKFVLQVCGDTINYIMDL